VEKLTEHAIELSSYGIVVTFLDSDGNAVAPRTVTWSLTDQAGTVINSRKDVSITNPTSIETIVLSGDDLQIITAGSRQEARKVIIEGTYDDSTLGNDIPFRQEIQFVVDNITEAVTPSA